MVILGAERIPSIVNALSSFRLGHESRLVQGGRPQKEFVDFGWKRAAAAAGLDESQRLAFSCLFIAQFISPEGGYALAESNSASVGFYLHEDPERNVGRVYLARSDLPATAAMSLIRLNPDGACEFPCGEPWLISTVTYSWPGNIQRRSFVRIKDLWWRKIAAENWMDVKEPSLLKVSTVFDTSAFSPAHPAGRLVLEGDALAALGAAVSGWTWVLAEEADVPQDVGFDEACPLIPRRS